MKKKEDAVVLTEFKSLSGVVRDLILSSDVCMREI